MPKIAAQTVHVKTIGQSGQISLGKEYAGQHAIVEAVEPGVWVIRIGKFVPNSERWLWEPEAMASLDRAIAWAEKHGPKASNLDVLVRKSRARR